MVPDRRHGKGGDVVIDFVEQDTNRYLSELEKRLQSRPVCDQCEQPIFDDSYIEFDDEKFCSECWDKYVREHFLKYVE